MRLSWCTKDSKGKSYGSPGGEGFFMTKAVFSLGGIVPELHGKEFADNLSLVGRVCLENSAWRERPVKYDSRRLTHQEQGTRIKGGESA